MAEPPARDDPPKNPYARNLAWGRAPVATMRIGPLPKARPLPAEQPAGGGLRPSQQSMAGVLGGGALAGVRPRPRSEPQQPVQSVEPNARLLPSEPSPAVAMAPAVPSERAERIDPADVPHARPVPRPTEAPAPVSAFAGPRLADTSRSRRSRTPLILGGLAILGALAAALLLGRERGAPDDARPNVAVGATPTAASPPADRASAAPPVPPTSGRAAAPAPPLAIDTPAPAARPSPRPARRPASRPTPAVAATPEPTASLPPLVIPPPPPIVVPPVTASPTPSAPPPTAAPAPDPGAPVATQPPQE